MIIGPLAASASVRTARLLPSRMLPEAPTRTLTAPLDMDVGTSQLYQLGAELLQIRVKPGSRLHGVYVSELRLPPATTLGLLVRDGHSSPPGNGTQLQTDDVLLVFTHPAQRLAAEQRIRAVHRSGRLAQWRGDCGA